MPSPVDFTTSRRACAERTRAPPAVEIGAGRGRSHLAHPDPHLRRADQVGEQHGPGGDLTAGRGHRRPAYAGAADILPRSVVLHVTDRRHRPVAGRLQSPVTCGVRHPRDRASEPAEPGVGRSPRPTAGPTAARPRRPDGAAHATDTHPRQRHPRRLRHLAGGCGHRGDSPGPRSGCPDTPRRGRSCPAHVTGERGVTRRRPPARPPTRPCPSHPDRRPTVATPPTRSSSRTVTGGRCTPPRSASTTSPWRRRPTSPPGRRPSTRCPSCRAGRSGGAPGRPGSWRDPAGSSSTSPPARAATGRQCIGAATSKAATGPFTTSATEPLVCQPELGRVDRPLPVRRCGRCALPALEGGRQRRRPRQRPVRPAPGTEGLTLTGDVVPLLRNDAAWETPLIENPALCAWTGGTSALLRREVGVGQLRHRLRDLRHPARTVHEGDHRAATPRQRRRSSWARAEQW